MKRQIHSLTALRAVAAALVFFYHFVYLPNPVPAQNLINMITQNGFIGVNLMFVLSGFLLTTRYYNDVAQKKLRWRDYYKRRMVRLYPSYFVMLAGIALLGAPVNLANVTITQGFFTHYFQTGIINSWSLTAEECYYFMLPGLLWVLLRSKSLTRQVAILIAWALGVLLLGLVLVRWSQGSGAAQATGFMGDDVFALSRTFFGFGIEYAIGTFTALIYLRHGACSTIASTILAMVSGVGIAGCIVLMTLYPDPLTVRLLRYAVAGCCGGLIFALTCDDFALSRLMSWRPFVYLGRLSYGVYLIQLTQLVWFMAGWPVLLFYAGCNVASAFLYHLIEQPARSLFLKRGLPTKKAPTYEPKLVPILDLNSAPTIPSRPDALLALHERAR